MANRLLYLVRHGEPEDLETEWEDAALSDLGRQQARLLGERLRGVPFAAVFHSPLRRAAQTAELIAESLPGVPVSPSALLADCVPSAPDRDLLPPAWAEFLDGLPAAERTQGRRGRPRPSNATRDRPGRTGASWSSRTTS